MFNRKHVLQIGDVAVTVKLLIVLPLVCFMPLFFFYHSAALSVFLAFLCHSVTQLLPFLCLLFHQLCPVTHLLRITFSGTLYIVSQLITHIRCKIMSTALSSLSLIPVSPCRNLRTSGWLMARQSGSQAYFWAGLFCLSSREGPPEMVFLFHWPPVRHLGRVLSPSPQPGQDSSHPTSAAFRLSTPGSLHHMSAASGCFAQNSVPPMLPAVRPATLDHQHPESWRCIW